MIYPKKLNPFRVTKSTAIFGSVFTFLVMYNLADNLAPRGVFYWREIYAVVYLGILITSLISFFLCRTSHSYGSFGRYNDAKCSYIDAPSWVSGPTHNLVHPVVDISPSFVCTNTCPFGAFLDLFPQEHKAFCDWLNISLT